MRIIAILAAVAAALAPANAALPADPAPVCATCFKTGENSPGGMYKDCYYNCLGSQVTISIPSYQVCPVTIER